jgi:pilus assembly protein Flp/PilA
MISEQPELKQERGASMVEYALLVVLIALAAFLAVRFAGNNLSRTYSNIAVEVSNAGLPSN